MNQEKKILFTLAALQFTYIMDFMIIMPMSDMIMTLFKVTPQQFSYIVSSYTFSSGICLFISTLFIDKFDRKRLLIAVYIGFILGTVGCALSYSYYSFLLFRIITGAFAGLLGALVLTIISDIIPQQRRSAAMGIVMAAFSASAVLGVPFGYLMAITFSWHFPFLFLAVVGSLFLIPIVKYIPSLKDHLTLRDKSVSTFNHIKAVLSNINVIKALSFTVLLILGQFTVVPFITPYMIRNVGFEPSQITYIYLCGGALTIFSSPFIGKMADKHGRLKTFMILAAISIIPLFSLTHLPPVSVWIAIIVTTVFFVFISGRMIPATAMITSVVKQNQRGSFLTLNTAVREFTLGIASFISGYVVIEDVATSKIVHYNWIGYIAIGSTILALLLSKRLILSEE